MHTSIEPGINLDRAKELTEDYTWVPIVEDEREAVTEEDVEVEFARLSEYEDVAPEGDQLNKRILIEDVFDISVLDEIWKGKVTITVEEELGLAKAGDKGKP